MIPLSEAIDFLSQAAPRPWVTRMLHAMLLNDELQAWFLSGRIRSEVMVAEILSQVDAVGLAPPSTERDEQIRKELGDELAELIAGKDWKEYFVEYDEPIESYDGFVFADLGFVHYGTIDWETGEMSVEYIPERSERPDHLFSGIEDMIGTEYRQNSPSAQFTGMHLAREKVELLLPTHRLSSGGSKATPYLPEPKRTGRPPKWDWEAALAYIVAQAQTPDGLPVGPGSQAKIEVMMAEWFEAQTGDSPSVSQIRTRASTIIEMIGRAKVDKAHK